MIDLCSIRLFGPIENHKPVADDSTTTNNANGVDSSSSSIDHGQTAETRVARSLVEESLTACSPAENDEDGDSTGSTNCQHQRHGQDQPRPSDLIVFYKSMIPEADAIESSTACSTAPSDFETVEEEESKVAFTALRCNYLLVTLTVMLADGLQGTGFTRWFFPLSCIQVSLRISSICFYYFGSLLKRTQNQTSRNTLVCSV